MATTGEAQVLVEAGGAQERPAQEAAEVAVAVLREAALEAAGVAVAHAASSAGGADAPAAPRARS